MITTQISLPDRTHFKLVELAEALAKSTPKEPDNSTGIDCLRAKLLEHFTLKFDLQQTIPDLEHVSDPQYLFRIKGFKSKYPLTEDDRETLRPILNKLPKISNYMSTEEIEQFFDQYYKILNRPSWEPDITSPADRQRMKENYDKQITKHCDDFISMVKNRHCRLLHENLTILTGNELTAAYAQRVALVTKEDAAIFCKSLGIELKLEVSKQLDHQSDTDSPQIAPSVGTTGGKKVKKWTPEYLAEVAAYRLINGTKNTAKEYAVSEAMIRKMLPSERKSDKGISSVNWIKTS